MAGGRSKVQKAKNRRPTVWFSRLPAVLMDTEDFRKLSGSAHKILLALLRQYRGNNNGDLSITFSEAKHWGIGSKATLQKAKQELIDRNLIIKTREGCFINPGAKCDLFAITWEPIDECDGKLDVAPTTTAPRKFRQSPTPQQKAA